MCRAHIAVYVLVFVYSYESVHAHVYVFSSPYTYGYLRIRLWLPITQLKPKAIATLVTITGKSKDFVHGNSGIGGGSTSNGVGKETWEVAKILSILFRVARCR